MKKILIADIQPELLQSLEVILTSELNNPIEKITNLGELTQLTENDISLVAGYESLKSRDHDFFNKLAQLDIPFVILSPNNADHFIENIQEILAPTKEKPQFRKVDAEELSAHPELSLDLYMQVGQEKIIKVANKENQDMHQRMKHFIEKGAQDFFLTEKDFESIQVTGESSSSPQSSHTPIEYEIQTLGVTFNLAQEQLEGLNIPRGQDILIMNGIEKVTKGLSKEKKFFALIKNFFSEDNYLVTHSMLNIFFCSYLLDKLAWSNEQTLRQFVYASFFHDIELKNPDLAKVQDLSSISERKDITLIKEHMAKSAQVVEKLKGMNTDAYRIILDHHERPDGSGFPRGLNASNIPPLSCVFLISHEIVDFLINENFKTVNLVNKIHRMQETWEQGNFKRPFECARSILLE